MCSLNSHPYHHHDANGHLYIYTDHRHITSEDRLCDYLLHDTGHYNHHHQNGNIYPSCAEVHRYPSHFDEHRAVPQAFIAPLLGQQRFESRYKSQAAILDRTYGTTRRPTQQWRGSSRRQSGHNDCHTCSCAHYADGCRYDNYCTSAIHFPSPFASERWSADTATLLSNRLPSPRLHHQMQVRPYRIRHLPQPSTWVLPSVRRRRRCHNARLRRRGTLILLPRSFRRRRSFSRTSLPLLRFVKAEYDRHVYDVMRHDCRCLV